MEYLNKIITLSMKNDVVQILNIYKSSCNILLPWFNHFMLHFANTDFDYNNLIVLLLF